MLPLHSLHYLIFVGITTALLNDFLKLLGNIADFFLSSMMLKF